jgi:hypothetical protein
MSYALRIPSRTPIKGNEQRFRLRLVGPGAEGEGPLGLVRSEQRARGLSDCLPCWRCLAEFMSIDWRPMDTIRHNKTRLRQVCHSPNSRINYLLG